MSSLTLGDLEARIRKMLALIVRNRTVICGPTRGVLELHFRGGHVEAKLIAHQRLVLPSTVQEDDGAPPAA